MSQPLRRQQSPPLDGKGGGGPDKNSPGLPGHTPEHTSVPRVQTTPTTKEVTIVKTLPGQITTAISTALVPTTVQITLSETGITTATVTSSAAILVSQPQMSTENPPTLATTIPTSMLKSKEFPPTLTTAVQNTRASAKSSSLAPGQANRLSAAVIAGGVIAGTIICAGCALLVYILRRRRRKERHAIEPDQIQFDWNEPQMRTSINDTSTTHLIDRWQPTNHSLAAALASPTSTNISPSRPQQDVSMSSWVAAELPRQNETILRENEEFWEEIEDLRRQNDELRSRTGHGAHITEGPPTSFQTGWA